MFGTTGCWRKWRSGSTTRTSCTYHRHLTGPNRKGIAFGENASKQDFCAIVEGDEEDFPYISLSRFSKIFRSRANPTCAESTPVTKQINELVEKLALHFW